MESSNLNTFAPWETHKRVLEEYWPTLIANCQYLFLTLAVMSFLVKGYCDNESIKKREAANTTGNKTSWEKYDPQSPACWYYVSNYTSSFFALFICYTGVVALYTSCGSEDVPKESVGFFGTNWSNDDRCLDNSTPAQLQISAYFATYMIFDLCSMVFMQRDFSPKTYSTFAHHIVGLTGAYYDTKLGLFFGVTGALNYLTEISTANVNMRYLLYYHDRASTSLYIFNGLMMTGLFGIARIALTLYVNLKYSLPAMLRLQNQLNSANQQDSEELHHVYTMSFVQLGGFTVLQLLNFYWFYKMVNGCIKALSKKKNKTQ